MHLMNQDNRRKNIRLALILAGLVLLIMLTSVPFWTGLVEMIGDSAQ